MSYGSGSILWNFNSVFGYVARCSVRIFMKHDMSERLSRILTGFAAGVMVAASIWSLLIPAVDQSEEMGKFAFIPAAAGFGVAFCFCFC